MACVAKHYTGSALVCVRIQHAGDAAIHVTRKCTGEAVINVIRHCIGRCSNLHYMTLHRGGSRLCRKILTEDAGLQYISQVLQWLGIRHCTGDAGACLYEKTWNKE